MRGGVGGGVGGNRVICESENCVGRVYFAKRLYFFLNFCSICLRLYKVNVKNVT